jgi:hypothetical protein
LDPCISFALSGNIKVQHFKWIVKSNRKLFVSQKHIYNRRLFYGRQSTLC